MNIVENINLTKAFLASIGRIDVTTVPPVDPQILAKLRLVAAQG